MSKTKRPFDRNENPRPKRERSDYEVIVRPKNREKKPYLKPDSRIGAAVAGPLISLPIDS